jgi:GNAT superfamily N-acetyltransferase
LRAPLEIQISLEPVAKLAEYALVPIAFEVRSVVDVNTKGDAGALVLCERPIGMPWIKDYDSIQDEGPASWRSRFDPSNCTIFAAHSRGRRVGGAVVVFRSPGVEMLEGRDDLAVLWDIRVAPDVRGSGVGTALLRAAESWAASNGAASMKVETQNINVPACRFYLRHGYVLRAANLFAYPELPDETQLLWYKDLPSTNSPGSSR